MAKKQEHYTAYRLGKHSLVVEGHNTEIVLKFEDVMAIVNDLGKNVAQPPVEDSGVVPRPRMQPVPLKFGDLLGQRIRNT